MEKKLSAAPPLLYIDPASPGSVHFTHSAAFRTGFGVSHHEAFLPLESPDGLTELFFARVLISPQPLKEGKGNRAIPGPDTLTGHQLAI